MKRLTSLNTEAKCILLLSLLAFAQAITHFGVVYDDSKNYFSATRFIEGWRPDLVKPSAVSLAARPLLPVVVIPFDLVFGLPIAYGIVNTIFWVFSAILLFLLVKKLTGSLSSSLYASFLLSTTWPMVLYGAASMTEAIGLFFTLLTVYLTLSLPERKLNKPKLLLLGLIVGLGALSREVVLAAFMSAFIILMYRKDYHSIIWWFIPALCVIFFYQVYAHFSFGVNYLTHYLSAGIEHTTRRGMLSTWLDPVWIGKAFLIGHAPLAALTLILGFLEEKRREVLVIFYMLFIPAFACFVIWPFHDLRLAVMLYHATMPLAGIGFEALIKSLSSKPILNFIPVRLWALLLISLNLIFADWWTYAKWGQLSLPWDIYFFAHWGDLRPP